MGSILPGGADADTLQFARSSARQAHAAEAAANAATPSVVRYANGATPVTGYRPHTRRVTTPPGGRGGDIFFTNPDHHHEPAPAPHENESPSVAMSESDEDDSDHHRHQHQPVVAAAAPAAEVESAPVSIDGISRHDPNATASVGGGFSPSGGSLVGASGSDDHFVPQRRMAAPNVSQQRSVLDASLDVMEDPTATTPPPHPHHHDGQRRHFASRAGAESTGPDRDEAHVSGRRQFAETANMESAVLAAAAEAKSKHGSRRSLGPPGGATTIQLV
ncbi:hypothetical protein CAUPRSCDRAFT_12212 [Caulochytrium protostelioides]|uniref:Uncharacterized protein n=1 Tax=Caulochytrium protostelioides TaxID=1555241 RepID=A0A4P9WVD8_9FUNG|nr:hypothetical protein CAUPRSCDRAFT_12212 [Caulochytrium protostelioides]